VNKVIMYSTQVCPYCQMAERLLKSRGVEQVEKVLIDKDPARREEMMARTGRRTVPQVFIGETHVGGYDDLSALDRAGGLMPLLEAAGTRAPAGARTANEIQAGASLPSRAGEAPQRSGGHGIMRRHHAYLSGII
jgi:glutaredoxin 3